MPAAAHAQEIVELSVAPENTLLTLTAKGKVSRKPDLAIFTAGVTTTGKTAGEALGTNAAAMNRVIRALKVSGIAEKDIQTSNLNLNPAYGNRQQSTGTLEDQAPPIIGYRASNNVTVKQRDLGEFGKVIDTLVSAGANQVSGPSFKMVDPGEALDDARRDAITKARQRAELYARTARLSVRRIVSISETGSYAPGPRGMYARSMAMEVAESTPVSAGEVEMQANVTVTFELAP